MRHEEERKRHLRAVPNQPETKPSVDMVSLQHLENTVEYLERSLLTEFSHAVHAKGERIFKADGVLPDPQHSEVLWVRSETDPDQKYRIQVGRDGWFVTCTCRHGLNKGGGSARCSHVAAVYMWAVAQVTKMKEGR